MESVDCLVFGPDVGLDSQSAYPADAGGGEGCRDCEIPSRQSDSPREQQVAWNRFASLSCCGRWIRLLGTVL